jgi:hypothetical protein
VRFGRATSEVVISTKAPSVAAYFDEDESGSETPQGQVMLVELMTESACREIARRGVESGTYLMIGGAEAYAIQREYISLQNRYAHVIHACFVEAKYRRNVDNEQRKGRPKKEECQSRNVFEA